MSTVLAGEMVIRHGQNWPSSVCERSLFLHATFKFIMKKICNRLSFVFPPAAEVSVCLYVVSSNPAFVGPY